MHNANNHVNKTPLHKCLGNNALARWQPAAPDHFTQHERLVAALQALEENPEASCADFFSRLCSQSSRERAALKI
jgi:hypothetical protein